MLDPALLRPGRFDRHVVVPTPDINGREKNPRIPCGKCRTFQGYRSAQYCTGDSRIYGGRSGKSGQ
ncbi:MAG: hypothetical protein ACJ0DI_10220 [bacterium]